MTTAAEALAACLALGTPRDVCEEKVKSQMVGGAYCDGTIVLAAGAAPRCVPRSVLDAKAAAAVVPTTSAPSPAGASVWAIAGVVAAAGAVGVVAWLALRPR